MKREEGDVRAHFDNRAWRERKRHFTGERCAQSRECSEAKLSSRATAPHPHVACACFHCSMLMSHGALNKAE